MKLANVILLSLGLGASMSLQAQDVCTPQGTVVYYGNGVGRGEPTHGDAEDGKRRIAFLVNQALSEPDRDRYSTKLAFNSSAGRLGDITEAARQTLGNEWPTLLAAFLLRDTRLLSLLPPEVVRSFNDFLTNQSIQELMGTAAGNADVGTHVASYSSDIDEGKKVVLVSHSQGNIYANLAYQRLDASRYQPYFAMVPVASPESTSRKSLVGHVRFSQDLVIGGVELAKRLAGLSPPMAANDSVDASSDSLAHGFVEAYLADGSARNFIVSGAIQTSEGLQQPQSNTAAGAVTVTLTWGAQPDVDLHVYEPTNYHVFYRSLVGQFGELDLDDTSSFGPEHYVLSCSALRERAGAVGRYRIGVNYYAGSGGETAKVTVKTSGEERTFTKALPAARGSSGDNSPVPVADVVVTKDPETGQFSFAIEGQ